MNFDFSNSEIIFIYGHFKQELKKLKDLKSTPNCTFSKVTINKDIKLYSSIVDKMENAHPELKTSFK